MKKGIILTNAYFESAASRYQAERLKEELEKLGAGVEILRNDFHPFSLDGDLHAAFPPCDFCVYLDKDKYVSQLLEKSSVRLFNTHAAIQACDDKMLTAILLVGHGIPMPKTVPGLLCYDPAAVIPLSAVERIERALGYPVVVKTVYGSRGTGVFKAENRAELTALCEKLKCVPHLFQQFVMTSYGRDLRVIVVGGRIVAAMERVSDGDFRSNIDLGGRGRAVELPEEAARLCLTAADILGLDYCGVDVLFGKDGYLLCEVNSNAFFDGMERATGANIAAAYARHIRERIG